MVAGILLVGVSQLWLAELQPDSGVPHGRSCPPRSCAASGLGLSVTPLTAAVLDAVGDADLGEASAINDAASRVGGVIAVALVPLLIGVTAGASLARRAGDRLRAGDDRDRRDVRSRARSISLVFVSDKPSTAPRIAAPDRGCALPIPGTTEVRT